MRRKRPFLFIELIVAFFLVALFIFPFMHHAILHIKNQKNHLINLEEERLAEKLFFSICNQLDREIIDSNKKPHYLPNTQITCLCPPFDPITLYWHYHLYFSHEDNKEIFKMHCIICFRKTKSSNQVPCNPETKKNKQHIFDFIIKRKTT